MEKTYFIETKEQYLEIVKSWKDFVNSKKTIYNSHMVLYNIFRSKSFDKGFTPVTKVKKLENGCHEWQGLKNATYNILRAAIYGSGVEALLKPFGETLNREDIKKAWEAIKEDPRLK